MTLTELRKRLPKDALIKVTPPGILGEWDALCIFGDDDCDPNDSDADCSFEWKVEVHVYDHRTRKDAVAALAEKLEEIGVLK